MKPLLIVGSYLSPYVRKALVCLELKGIPYEVDPIVPFYGDDRFSTLSPLRRIPVLVDGDLVLTDSSVICQYVEDLQPGPALFPADIRDRARARWLEEYADSRMGDVFIWRLFNEVAIKPSVWGEKGDRALVERTLSEDVPAVLDYLESEAPVQAFRFGALSIGDIAPACFATPPSPDSRSMPRAGRRRRAGSRGPWPRLPSPSSRPSRMRWRAHPSPSIATP
jgi:glutathione S-transferase